jgi:polysaccharide transporter, PST family
MISIVLATAKLRPHWLLFCVTYFAVIGDLLFPLWLFQGLQKIENLVWRDLSAKFLSLILIFAFVRRDSDYLWAAGFQAGSAAIAGIIGLITVPFLTPVRWAMPSVREAVTALREGWPVFLSMAAMSLTASTNILILGLRSGPTDVAFYTAAGRLIVALRMLVSPLVTALYPHISHMAHISRENAIAFLRKYGPMLMAPFFAGSLILFAGASPVMRILYGLKYIEAVPLLRILALSPLFCAMQHIYSTFFMLAFGYEKEWSRVILWSTVLNFAVLIPLMYLIWPPAATSVAVIVVDLFVAVIPYAFYRKRTTAALPPAVPA